MTQPDPRKRKPGQPFTKGVSGNPGGRPKIFDEVRQRAQAGSAAAIDELEAIMLAWREDPKNAPSSVKAAELILAYAVGRPTVSVDLGDNSQSALERLADALTRKD